MEKLFQEKILKTEQQHGVGLLVPSFLVVGMRYAVP